MIFKFDKKSLLLFAIVLMNFTGYAQSLYAPKIQSPNAASLGTFTEVPVNLFTGTPDISIPLHTLFYGNIKVPISLRYNASSVKPAQQPGWAGSGWDLQSTGMISRQQRGMLDELYLNGTGAGFGPNIGTYYPYPGQTTQPGSEYNAASNWNSAAQLQFDFYTYSTGQTIAGIDVEADEFSFNVMGHSGKFYYAGATKGWQVVSDEKIKIDMNGFLSSLDINNIIHSYNLPFQSAIPYGQSRAFSGFTLTVADGTKYIFGGPDAIEFSSPIYSIYQTLNGPIPAYTANTWLLNRIIDVNGNMVDFSYLRKSPTCIKSRSLNYNGGTCYEPGGVGNAGGGSASFSSGNSDIQVLAGTMIWPMYLNSIESPNESVKFTCSDHIYNKYSDDMLNYVNQYSHTTNDIDNSILGLDWPTNITRLRWQKLDNIAVTDKMHNSNGANNYNPNIIKQYQFIYLNSSSSPNQRLMLGSLKAMDKQSNIVGQYQFEYNTDISTMNGTPIYADGNFADHWGFYNHQDLTTIPLDFYNKKQPNALTVTAELLKKLTYPTGGYSSFLWEPNDYSQVVAPNRQALNAASGFAGGCRINEIKNILQDGTVASDKKYFYKNGYTGGSNPSALSSSGVLNGIPSYTYGSYGLGCMGINTYGFSSTSMNGTGNYGYTGQGAPIGYKEVTELNVDGSYTKSFFTNYDADINGISHFDKPPSGFLGWKTGDTYFPYSSLELERGKPIATFLYAVNNTLVQKTNLTYRNDASRFNSSINIVDFGGIYGSGYCAGDALVMASAHSVYTYAYYPINRKVTTYDQNGGNPIVESTDLEYNSNNLINKKTTTNSRGETIVINNTYTTEATDNTSIQMAAAHIYTPIISVLATKNGAPYSFLQTNYTQPYTGIFVPGSTQVKVGANPIETTAQVNKYDLKGHAQEIQKPNGVKEVNIWGCNSQYIMAKIIGADYATASALIDQTKLDQAGVGYNNYSDADIRAELNKLRTGLPNALVTTYTYACGVGMTSETDPAGRTTYYEYDGFARLMDIRDQDFNLIKKMCYNYAGQPENCTTAGFTNDIQEATFTSTATCAPGTTPATYHYVVPAGTFTSFVDKPTANQMAIMALNSNGQAAANTMPCQATFSSINSTSAPWTATLTNLTTGVVSVAYSVYPSSTATLLATIPIGNYNLSLVPMYSGSVTSPINLLLNGNTYSGTSFNMNITVNTATTFTLQTPVASGPCSFTMASGYSTPTNNISNSGTTVSFYIVWYSTSTITQGNAYQVATINGACRPSAMRIVPVTVGGRSWTITIYPNGQMFWQMAYGSAPLNAYSTVGTTTLTYNL